MIEFQVGIFASLVDEYDPEEGRYVQHIRYVVKDWCDEKGIAYRAEEGMVFVCHHNFTFDEAQGITREQVILGMVEGLEAKKRSIQADAQATITNIDQKIGSLLMLRAPSDDTEVQDV